VVGQGLAGWRLDAAFNELPGGWVDAQLASSENQMACADAGGIRADGLGGFICDDNLFLMIAATHE
jgi:hypothetical protein